MRYAARAIYEKIINPPRDENILATKSTVETPLPTLWLLGKTGAGKSSIIQRLTGDSAAEIGNGFRPCTSASYEYRVPEQHTVLRFLDTRGLGEASYDPTEDIQSLARDSHAILLIIRLKDPEQSSVLAVVEAIRKSAHREILNHVLVVFTGALEIASEQERKRLQEYHHASISKVLGRHPPDCMVDFAITTDGELDTHGEEQLRGQLTEILPRLSLFLANASRSTQEARAFQCLKSDILWYATAAAATDAIPAAGLVTVPAIQGKLLHSLAQKHGIDWDRKTFARFAGALGSGFGLAYTGSLAGRQLAKLIPAWGQVAGTALSVSISYATTFALGRAACYYLHHSSKGDEVNTEELRSLYRDALQRARAQGKEMARETDQ